MVAQKLIHMMRWLWKEKKRFVVVIVDLENAYNSLDWNFIEDTLKACQDSKSLREAIMACVCSPTMHILWNGETTTIIEMRMSIQQVCPLSPYFRLLHWKIGPYYHQIGRVSSMESHHNWNGRADDFSSYVRTRFSSFCVSVSWANVHDTISLASG